MEDTEGNQTKNMHHIFSLYADDVILLIEIQNFQSLLSSISGSMGIEMKCIITHNRNRNSNLFY